jgi:hypothetical protein
VATLTPLPPGSYAIEGEVTGFFLPQGQAFSCDLESPELGGISNLSFSPILANFYYSSIHLTGVATSATPFTVTVSCYLVGLANQQWQVSTDVNAIKVGAAHAL